MKTMILLAEGLEECEALVTYDLLFRAGIETDLVGLKNEVTSSHKVTIKAHKNINDIKSDDYDCLVLPGGMPGTLNLENDSRVQNLIDEFIEKDKYVAAICAAPSILIHKNLINDNKFICHPGFENGLTPVKQKAYCDNKIITGKGLGAAFEFAYIIISKLINEDKAKEVLNKTQY